MGIELVILWIGIAAAAGFGVNKGVELIKHSNSIDADKYNSCVSAAKDPRACRTLE
jgi:hypothetical protein